MAGLYSRILRNHCYDPFIVTCCKLHNMSAHLRGAGTSHWLWDTTGLDSKERHGLEQGNLLQISVILVGTINTLSSWKVRSPFLKGVAGW